MSLRGRAEQRGAGAVARKPRVAVIGTGGTISSVGRHSLDLYEYMDYGRRQEADELVGRFPEVGAAADVIPIRFRSISSSAVSPADWLALQAAVHEVMSREPGLLLGKA